MHYILGIDAREIEEGVSTGIGRALDTFLSTSALLHPDRAIVLFATQPLAVSYDYPIQTVVAPPASTWVWDQWVLPKLIRKSNIDLFLSPYYKVPLFSPVPAIATIFDLMYLTWPKYRQRLSAIARLYYAVMGRVFLSRARSVWTCSDFSQSEIYKLYPRSRTNVISIPLGIPDSYAPSCSDTQWDTISKRYTIAIPYIFYCGNFKKHKNTQALGPVLGRVRQNLPHMKLVLTGPPDCAADALVTGLREQFGADSVTFTGLVPLQDQVVLYRYASACIVPSWHEGFGYPVVEAFACGCPVVCSNAASLPQLAGDAAVVCAPGDTDAMADAVFRFCSDQQERSTRIKAGLDLVEKNYRESVFTKRLWEYFDTVFVKSSTRQ